METNPHDELPRRRRRPPARSRSWPGLLLVLVALGALGWWLYPREASPPEADTFPPDALPARPADGDAPPRFPIGPDARSEADPEALPMPELGDSDAAVIDALAALLPRGALDRLLVPEFVIPRVVASIDNLPRTSLPARMHPVRPVAGRLQVAAGEPAVIAEANARRYDERIDAMESVDPAALVDVYVRWYPRFEQAYRELGYPGAHFNDRLVEVVDHLLATPEVGQPLAVRRTERGYEYAEPGLESASVGQRAMWRIGPGHAARVKAWLQALRAELVSRGPATDATG